MTSKNLFFKLIKEDLKSRIWLAALVALEFFFLFPVAAAFNAGTIQNYDTYTAGLKAYKNAMENWFAFSNSAMVMAMIVTALVCGLGSFSYLYSRSKVDFYHSIPVRREKIYLANYIDGILIPAVFYAVFLIAGVAVAASNGLDAGSLAGIALEGYGLTMIYYIFGYTVIVLAALLTGNLVVGFLGAGVFALFAPGVIYLAQQYFVNFFDTYTYLSFENVEKWGYRFSPLSAYLAQVSRYLMGEAVWTEALVTLAAALLLAVVGCLIHKRRASEAAGRAMAFRRSCPVIRCLVVLACGQYLGLFMWSMRTSVGWAVFGVIVGTVITHCLMEIIFHFDFRKLFCGKLQLAGCGVVSLLVLFAFRYDVFRYDEYLPQADQLQSVVVQISNLNDWVSYGYTEQLDDGSYVWVRSGVTDAMMERMEYHDFENLLEIASVGILHAREDDRDNEGSKVYMTDSGEVVFLTPEEAEEMGLSTAATEQFSTATTEQKREMEAAAYTVIGGADGPTSIFLAGKDNRIYQRDDDDFRVWTGVTICYTLNSGRSVYRTYHVYAEEILDALNMIRNDQEYLEAAYPVFTKSADEIARVRFRRFNGDTILEGLGADEKRKLLETYQKEFAAIMVSELYEEAPVGLIRFTTEADEESLAWSEANPMDYYTSWREFRYRYYNYNSGDVESVDYYPVYESFTETVKLLAAYGIEIGPVYRDAEVASLTVNYSFFEDDSYWSTDLTITDPDELEELQSLLVDDGLIYYNMFYRKENYISASVRLRKASDGWRYALFPARDVPQWLQDRIEENKELEEY
ncbi:MAG: sodium ion-translocating decarboxylase subunit beta [Clostridiales bacterium]|nr:sodium ion-translocating decarboxylase subunit beta [Clostridiales bacterium]